MNQSRRSFLRAGSMMGLAAVVTGRLSSLAFGQQDTLLPLGSSEGFAVPREAVNDPLYKITRAMFTENLKTKFSFRDGAVKLTDMRMVAVNDMNPSGFKSSGTTSRDCFSLTFVGPGDLPLRQGTYEVEHSKLGRFQLFIVPGHTGPGGIQYGALINRIYP